jgi:hypothetical protein
MEARASAALRVEAARDIARDGTGTGKIAKTNQAR